MPTEPRPPAAPATPARQTPTSSTRTSGLPAKVPCTSCDRQTTRTWLDLVGSCRVCADSRRAAAPTTSTRLTPFYAGHRDGWGQPSTTTEPTPTTERTDQ